MPVIIDTNCIAQVFSKSSLNHKEFEPILNWILKGKGLMIMGGSKYKTELHKLHKYLKIIRYIKEAGKIYEGDCNLIDNYQKKVEEINTDPDFDDPHLVALAFITKCKIICSEDDRSIKHVTDSKYYPSGFRKPVYYKSSKNSDLLSEKYVDDCLKPLTKINKSKSIVIEKMLK